MLCFESIGKEIPTKWTLLSSTVLKDLVLAWSLFGDVATQQLSVRFDVRSMP